MKNSINVTKALLPPLEEYCELLAEIWDTHMLTNFSKLHNRLEDKLKEYLEVSQISLCCNGHLGLESVLQSLDLKGEVITTPFTFASTTNAIIRCGLTPVFCDIRQEDYTLDPECIEGLITENTCAILPVHVFGQLCKMEEIETIGDKYHLPIIYDAAHIFGVKKRGDNPFLHGKASVISFHATKVYNTAEGGAIITQDEDLLNRLYLNSNFGIAGPEEILLSGGNAKLSEFHSAMGLCNLNHIDEEMEKRRKRTEIYRELLKDVDDLKLLERQLDVKSNYAYFPVLFSGKENIRDQVQKTLSQSNYYARKYFYPLTCDLEEIKNKYTIPDLPQARYVSERILCLPLYGDLEETYVRDICKIIIGEIKKQ